MKKRHTRLLFVTMLVAGLGTAAALGFMAMDENMLYFFDPTQLREGAAKPGQNVRVGGLVVPGSVQRGEGVKVRFDLTDNANQVTVHFAGILPDLFREGQGIIARGEWSAGGDIEAVEVLAKHDENYMPPEVAQSLKAKHANSNPGSNPDAAAQ